MKNQKPNKNFKPKRQNQKKATMTSLDAMKFLLEGKKKGKSSNLKKAYAVASKKNDFYTALAVILASDRIYGGGNTDTIVLFEQMCIQHPSLKEELLELARSANINIGALAFMLDREDEYREKFLEVLQDQAHTSLEVWAGLPLKASKINRRKAERGRNLAKLLGLSDEQYRAKVVNARKALKTEVIKKYKLGKNSYQDVLKDMRLMTEIIREYIKIPEISRFGKAFSKAKELKKSIKKPIQTKYTHYKNKK